MHVKPSEHSLPVFSHISMRKIEQLESYIILNSVQFKYRFGIGITAYHFRWKKNRIVIFFMIAHLYCPGCNKGKNACFFGHVKGISHHLTNTRGSHNVGLKGSDTYYRH